MNDQEMTKKLATEFFGWRFTDDVQVIGEHLVQGTISTIWFRRLDGTIGISGAVTCQDFDPLHDPAACALVKAELRRRRMIMEILLYSDKVIVFFPMDRSISDSEAETEERAVCLAVLKALKKNDLA